MQRPINYFAVFLVVAAGVTVGNLASHAIQTAFWMVAWQQSIDQFRAEIGRTFGDSDDVIEQARSRLDEQSRITEKRLRHERQGSATAKRLASHCSLWRKNHDMTPTDTTARAVQYYCGGYDRFIETGKTPRGDAPLLETR